MILINLLPASRRMPQYSFFRIFMITGFVIFLFCAIWYGYGSYRIWTLNQEIFKIMNRYELLLPVQSRMQTADDMQNCIDQKERLLLKLTSQRQSNYVILARLSEMMPAQVWLHEMTIDEQKRLTIKGHTAVYSDLALFLEAIEKNSLFADPVLLRVERDETLNAMKFEISVVVKGM